MRPLAVLVAGDPIPRVRAERGSYAEMIRSASAGAWRGSFVDVDLRGGAELPDPRSVSGIVVTGSAASVTERAPWMLRAEAYLREVVVLRVPTFGICFGHQLLGQALGGDVARNPLGREIGTVDLEVLETDPLLDELPPPPHRVNATHVDTVLRLPEAARVLARTRLDPNAMVRFGEAAWGVQFHPEMDRVTIRAYLEDRREILLREGLAPDALLASADDGTAGASLLPTFLRFISGR